MNAYDAITLALSLLAILIATISIMQQGSGVRRSNLMIYMTEKGEFFRSKEYREAWSYIITELSEFNPATVGVYDLPEPAIDYVLLVGGFYQDIGLLVVTGVIQEDLAAALYYRGIKEAWRTLEPYIRGERELRGAKGVGNFWGSFEDIAAYVDSVPHEKVRRKFLRRRFPIPAGGSIKPSSQVDRAPDAVVEHSDP